jgi:hypothetical protein
MITRVPITDTTTGQQVILEGDPSDRLPNDKTIYMDPHTGAVYEPGQELAKLPTSRPVIELPDTTWYA